MFLLFAFLPELNSSEQANKEQEFYFPSLESVPPLRIS